jgi:hypothetical protein
VRSALPHPKTGWSVLTAVFVVLVAPAIALIFIKGLLALEDYPHLASEMPPTPPPAPHAK